MNNPFGNNPTPPWGHTGQVGACQNNLEVGDRLTGTEAPRIVMPNGLTYHLQELVFFSWFYSSRSRSEFMAGSPIMERSLPTPAHPACKSFATPEEGQPSGCPFLTSVMERSPRPTRRAVS
jgi:hypothetical protein